MRHPSQTSEANSRRRGLPERVSLFLLFAALATVLGCESATDDAPTTAAVHASTSVQPAPTPPADDLRTMIDRVLDFTEHGRQMSLEKHAAWQLMHGVLAFGDKFEILAGDKKVVAVDWVFDGQPMKGWTITPTEQGLKAEIEPGKLGQGHEDQWLAILSQCAVPVTRTVRVGDRDYKVYDMVRRSMYDCWDGKESSWTIIALSTHLKPIDQTWKARDGEEWTVERLVSMEAGPVDDDEAGENLIYTGACGGTHRLIGLTIALNNYIGQFPNRELTGGWLAAKKRIDWAIRRAHENQLPSGAFSIGYFLRPANSANIDEHLAATGHTLEFLSFALPKEQLQQEWVERAVAYLCRLLERTKGIDLECGSLYHAAHGLVLYRKKVYGPRDDMVNATARR